MPDSEDSEALYKNLRNTEIDIVLETRERLYIGEAKDESGFGANGNLVLAHQLIRQYVMAKILLELKGGSQSKVVPFIVRNEPKGKNPAQIQFMKSRGWLKEGNILTWKEVEKLRGGSA